MIFRLVPTLLLLLATGCGATDDAADGSAAPDTQEVPVRPIADVLADHAQGVLDLDGVEVVYESALPDGTPCVKIGVAALTPELRTKLPETLEGHPVLVVETGKIERR